MGIDLKRFLAIPDDWAIRFTANGISESDTRRGIEAAQSVLKAANLHPFTSFIAYEFLNAVWPEFLAARMLRTDLEE